MASDHPWLQEFYPVPAEDATCSDEAALRHGLQKWKGLVQEALAKHDVTLDYDTVRDRDGHEVLRVAGNSCALCMNHYTADHRPGGVYSCAGCPLCKVRGVPCDKPRQTDPLKNSPYLALLAYKDPGPMIQLLARALAELHKESSDD